jgi:hypothetical protein
MPDIQFLIFLFHGAKLPKMCPFLCGILKQETTGPK